LKHNYYAALAEVKTIRNAVERGTLRDLVESRIRSEPWMISLLRHLDKSYYQFQEEHFPVVGDKLIVSSKESQTRPDVERFRRRIKARYKKPESSVILLLLPCSARKPYSFSPSHKRFKQAIEASGNKGLIHELIITSPLGIVPKELELFYPAQNYDIPVTHDWDRDEVAMVQDLLKEYLEGNRYEKIIVHLPEDHKFVENVLNDFTNTCKGATTSNESMDNLMAALKGAVSDKKKVSRKMRQLENIKNMARFQFGDCGLELVKDCTVKGRYPNLRIMKGNSQVGMLVGQRGMISLTLEGAKILAKNHSYWVEMHDFELKGNLFAVGVKDADPQIRIGDDVVVIKDNEAMGVGVAQMGPSEMIQSSRGKAVRMRHTA
jgi:archaeosine synthase